MVRASGYAPGPPGLEREATPRAPPATRGRSREQGPRGGVKRESSSWDQRAVRPVWLAAPQSHPPRPIRTQTLAPSGEARGGEWAWVPTTAAAVLSGPSALPLLPE